MSVSQISHPHTSCEACGDCHMCITNIERWGDPDGREGRIAEIRAQLAECHVAWTRGEPEPISNERRLELIDELAGLLDPNKPQQEGERE